jgi:hypothetical protein
MKRSKANRTAPEMRCEAAGIDDLPPPQIHEHLYPLPDTEWAVWRCWGLRSAGFPASEVLRLSAPECAVIADQLIDAEHDERQSRSAAIDAIQRELNTAPEADHRFLDKALKRLQKGKAPQLDRPGYYAKLAIEAVEKLHERRDALRDKFHQTYQKARPSVSEAIREIAGSSRFREAILWQNRSAYHSGLVAVLRRPAALTSHGSKHRQHEELIANYLQRYCVKNDTIGFFGPVGWAKVAPGAETIVARPGRKTLARRDVYFEGWCIDALAEVLSRDKTLLLGAAPRCAPYIHLDGRTIYQFSEPPIALSEAHAALVRACDGERPAREIARELLEAYPEEMRSEMHIYNILERMRMKRVISWAFDVPLQPHPELGFYRLIERIEDEGLRQRAFCALAELDAARRQVVSAAGDAEKLDHALENMEATFTRLTGLASSRAAGKMYAGRTLVYEDCLRDIEVDVGPQIISTLGPPLALLLTSARWLTYELASSYRILFWNIYERLVIEEGSSSVDAANFWTRIQQYLLTPKSQIVEDLLTSFHERWAKILEIPPEKPCLTYISERLRPLVREAFNAPGPGWESARYHSPDIMIAAESEEQIQRGDFNFVMGEIHVGINTLGLSFFLEQHPSPEDLFRAIELDLPAPRVVAVAPKHTQFATARTHVALVSPKDYRLEFALDSYRIPQSRTLPIGSLVIENCGDRLVARTRDRQVQFDLVEVLADALTGLISSRFKLLPSRRHSPRINFDRLVVARESWSFSASEISFAYHRDERERFLAARRWARLQRMPRFIFVKSPVEVKPVYIDLESPIYVDLLAKTVRRTVENDSADSVIVFVEMLPTHKQAWLPDAEGQRYTSEFRIVTVDQVGYGRPDS